MLRPDDTEFDVFFDSSDCLCAEEPSITKEELEIGIWLSEPESVVERRRRFFQRMGLTDFSTANEAVGLDRVREFSDAVPSSSVSWEHKLEGSSLFHGRELCCGSNSLSDSDIGDQYHPYEVLSAVREYGQGTDCCSCSENFENRNKKKPKRWWSRFILKKKWKKGDFRFEVSSIDPRVRRVKVQQMKKSYREFSAVLRMQEIQGHKGCISVLKFSPDGQLLASAGEDGVIRLWRVTTAYSPPGSSIGDAVSSFEVRTSSFGRKRYDQAPVIMPVKVFHIEETPLQELHGHDGVVSELAWSSSKRLLSASKDRTVRLWQVGTDQCLNVFHHTNHVTCVQFDPTNENYFISGSIDGKARIWGLSELRVVAWADTRSAISAISYRPGGKGFVVGSAMGNCRFYETSGNDVQLESQIQIQGGKKSSGNKITGIRFCVDKPERIVIASDDSRLRIIDGVNIVHKYKGFQKSGSQAMASFTSSRKYIVSAGEDSRVYVYNYGGSRPSSAKHTKSVLPCEYFPDDGVCVAVPWPGTVNNDRGRCGSGRIISRARAYSSDRFSFGSWFSLDSCRRISVTWPEEKLPPWDRRYDCHDDHYMNHHGSEDPRSRRTSLSEAWGHVIVTASRDGKIRTFHNYGLPIRI